MLIGYLCRVCNKKKLYSCHESIFHELGKELNTIYLLVLISQPLDKEYNSFLDANSKYLSELNPTTTTTAKLLYYYIFCFLLMFFLFFSVFFFEFLNFFKNSKKIFSFLQYTYQAMMLLSLPLVAPQHLLQYYFW